MTIRAAVLILGMSLATGSLASQEAGIARVGWLQGCWAMVSPQRVVEENWTAPRARNMVGVSRTLRGDTLATYELVIIRARDTMLIYEAHPAGQPVDSFPAIHVSDTAVVFENRAHDFPQRVGYRLRRDSLIAYVEGTMRGQLRRIDFPYAKVRCAGS